MTPIEQFAAIQRRIDILKNRPAYAYNALNPEQEEIIKEVIANMRDYIISYDGPDLNLTFNQTIRQELLVSWITEDTVHNLTISPDRAHMVLTSYDEADFNSDETTEHFGEYNLEKVLSLIKGEE